MRIYTHNGPAHIDDILAVGLLLNKYPTATVVRTNVIPEILDENDIVVDTGMRYDGRRFFDHHHNQTIPASFILVLKDVYGIEIDKELFPDIVHTEIADRLGPQKANEILGVHVPWQHPLVPVILNMISGYNVIQPGTFEHQLLIKIGEGLLRRIEGVYKSIDSIRKANVIETEKGLVVVDLDKVLNVNLVRRVYPDAVGVICKNTMNPEHISIISIDNNQHFRPEKVKNVTTPIFVHTTGFMSVVQNNFDIQKIINACL